LGEAWWRRPGVAILTLGIAAMLSGARSIYAIYQWDRREGVTRHSR
jgi:hypothetical protein